MGELVIIEQVGVSGKFTAWHFAPEDGPDAEPHEHTWHVKAKFEAPGRPDGRCYLAAFRAVLGTFEGAVLPRGKEWCTDIARAFLTLANCVYVEVERPDDESPIHGYAFYRDVS